MGGVVDKLADAAYGPPPSPPSRGAPPLADRNYADTAARMRPLKYLERDALNSTFRGALDPNSVYAIEGSDSFPVDTSVEPTLAGNTILLNPADVGRRNVAAHEATHIWQLRHGPVPDPPMNQDAYNYGGSRGLADAAFTGKPFSSFAPEQQAAIVGDSLGADPSRREPGVPDYRARLPQYQHYLNEVRGQPAPFATDPSDAFLESVYLSQKRDQRKKK